MYFSLTLSHISSLYLTHSLFISPNLFPFLTLSFVLSLFSPFFFSLSISFSLLSPHSLLLVSAAVTSEPRLTTGDVADVTSHTLDVSEAAMVLGGVELPWRGSSVAIPTGSACSGSFEAPRGKLLHELLFGTLREMTSPKGVYVGDDSLPFFFFFVVVCLFHLDYFFT